MHRLAASRVGLHRRMSYPEETATRNTDDRCPLCGGTKKPGRMTFTAELGFGVVVVRNVPATVCSQCGADWIGDDVAERIEALVNNAREKCLQVEVMSLA